MLPVIGDVCLLCISWLGVPRGTEYSAIVGF